MILHITRFFARNVPLALITFMLLGMATPDCFAQSARQPAQAARPTQAPPPQASTAPENEVTVGTRIVPPFVMKDGEQLSGFSIDLWHAIGAELGVKTRFVTYDALTKLLDGVRAGQNDAGIAAISITAKRGEALDFSQPMFRSGLSIMVPASGDKLDVLGLMFSSGMLKSVGIFLLILLIPAHVIWLVARGRDDGLPISERYIPGIFDAVFWCAESMGGAAQAHPSRVFARVAAIIWIYAGIVLISYFTAFATTSLTMQTLRGEINGPSDLRGKRVAVVEGSTSAAYAGELGASVVAHKNFEAAADAVLRGNAKAAVYDTPIIMYFTKNEPRAQIAGAQFRPESYGIIFPLGSKLRRPVDLALLKLLENGTYDSLYRKWFGQAEGGGSS